MILVVFQVYFLMSKNTILCGSVHENKKAELLKVIPFKWGTLPTKYLGVPLLAKQRGLSDCKSLIDNVEGRINCWKNKCLSYAGRIQLIALVLSIMLEYARVTITNYMVRRM